MRRSSSSLCSPTYLDSNTLPVRRENPRFAKQSSNSFDSSASEIPPIEFTVPSLIKPAWKPKKSSKPPTRPAFELPGEAFTRRKKALFEEKQRREEEEAQRRRIFKASGIRFKDSPSMPVKENVCSRARASIGKELEKELESRPPLSEERWPFVKKRPSSVLLQQPHSNGSPAAANHSLRRAQSMRTRIPGAANRPALKDIASMPASDGASLASPGVHGLRTSNKIPRRSSSFGSSAFSHHSNETADTASSNGTQTQRQTGHSSKFSSTLPTALHANMTAAGATTTVKPRTALASTSNGTPRPPSNTGPRSLVILPPEKKSPIKISPSRNKGKEIFEREKREAEERERQKKELQQKMEKARHDASEQSRMAVQLLQKKRILKRKSIIPPPAPESAGQKK